MGDESQKKVSELPLQIVKSIHLAIQRMEMYGIEHQVSQKAIDITYDLIRQLFDYTPTFTISKSDEQLLFDKVPFNPTYFTDRLVNDFSEFDIHSITFHRRLNSDEFVSFLKFLVRSPGRKLERLDIDQYLQDLGIESIAVDRVKYIAVTGEVDESMQSEKVLAGILSRYPEVLEKVLGQGSFDLLDTESGAQLLSFLPENPTELNVVDVLSALVKKTGVFDKSDENLSEADKELMKIIDSIRENLSEDAKRKFVNQIGEITKDIIVSSSQTEQLLGMEFDLRKRTILDDIFELFEEALEKGWNEDRKYRFAELIKNLFEVNDPDSITRLLNKFLDFFKKTGVYWGAETFKIIIEIVYQDSNYSVSIAFLNRILELKARYEPTAPESPLLTEALAFFGKLLLLSRKFSVVLRIMREFELQSQNSPTFEAISDSQIFISLLSSKDTLTHIFSTIGSDFSMFDIELKAILSKLDPNQLCEAVFEELGIRKHDFTTMANDLLKPHKELAMDKIDEYIQNLSRFERNDAGLIIDSAALHKSLNIFTLAVKIDKEWAFPALLVATSDSDRRIIRHVFFLLMIYPPKKVENVIQALFIESSEDFKKEIIQKIALKHTPTRDYYLRQILLYFPDFRFLVVKALGNVRNDFTMRILLELLKNWIIYIDPLPKGQIKRLLILIIRSLAPFASDNEVKKVLRKFRKEWKGEGILKESYSMFSRKKDDVMLEIDEVLAK